ncbi:MAG TPA: hypothetical protein EYH44_00025 [Thermoprotei archaeon]|nr:hypothetical protein [Thermoprotei archaeon]
MTRSIFEKYGVPLSLLGILIVVGTITFSIIEGRPLEDSFYYMITVLTTVGFGDITPSTTLGKIHFIIVISIGLALYGYFISTLASILSEEKLAKMFPGLYGYFTDGGKMSGHAIIIGWNQYAKNAYEEFSLNSVEAVVIVNDDEEAKRLNRDGIKAYAGSLDDPSTYEKLRFDYARGILITYTDPKESIVSILKIRRSTRKSIIISLILDEELVDVIKQAGADEVINIAEVGGRLLANSLIEPKATHLEIDMLSRGGLDVMEYEIKDNLKDKDIETVSSKINSHILAISRDDQYILKPPTKFRLRRGDRLILIGISEEMESDINRLDKE